jgi:hypothetical protein
MGGCIRHKDNLGDMGAGTYSAAPNLPAQLVPAMLHGTCSTQLLDSLCMHA